MSIYLEPNQKFSDYLVPPRASRNYPRSPYAPGFKSLFLSSSCKRVVLVEEILSSFEFSFENLPVKVSMLHLSFYSSFERFFCLSTVIAVACRKKLAKGSSELDLSDTNHNWVRQTRTKNH